MRSFSLIWNNFRNLLFVAVVAIIHLGSVSSQKSKCGNRKITRVVDDKNYTCPPCLRCPVGYGSTVECGKTVSMETEIKCAPCKQGTFKDHVGKETCQPCGFCSENEDIEKKCTAVGNIKCGKCRKFFYRARTGDCKPCDEIATSKTASDENRAKCRADGAQVTQPTATVSATKRPNSTVSVHGYIDAQAVTPTFQTFPTVSSHLKTEKSTSIPTTPRDAVQLNPEKKIIPIVPAIISILFIVFVVVGIKSFTRYCGKKAKLRLLNLRTFKNARFVPIKSTEIPVQVERIEMQRTPTQPDEKMKWKCSVHICNEQNVPKLVICITENPLCVAPDGNSASDACTVKKKRISFDEKDRACTLGNLKPKENEDKLVEMLNCAPGKAIELSEVFGMDDCFISRLERYWQDKKDIGSDVLHFLATKCPKLTVNDICVLLCEKDTSRIVQLATELQAKTEE